MLAVRIHQYGGPEVLSYDEVPMPQPGPSEARVKIAAAGVNFIDTIYRKGLYPNKLPFTLGWESAGVVDAVGAGVAEVQPGDRVVSATALGSYAEYVVVPAANLVPIPTGVTFEQAAAALFQGMTAHYLACSTYPLQPGDIALVHAASGGVGRLLVQIAKRRGARVLATVSTGEKAQRACSAGADDVIMYTQEDFEVAARRLTGGRGVDVVYDSVGKITFDQSLNSLRPRGSMVLYGLSSGPVPPLDPQMLSVHGSISLARPMLAHYIATREELLQRANDLFSWIAARALDIHIDATFPLAQAAEAHAYLESRKAKGKVLLEIRD